MTDVFTLAHISDLHLTRIAGFGPRHWNVKRGLGWLNWARKRRHIHVCGVADRLAADLTAEGADHVAVTGDLVHLGLPAEFAEALCWLQALGPPEKVSVVPGNHDIYTRRMRGPACLETWSAYMQSDAWGARYAVPQAAPFPWVRRAGPLALVGVNSAIPTRPFSAVGRAGQHQLHALARVLEALERDGVPRVVLIHHPPMPGLTSRSRALQDAAAVSEVIARHGASLVLYGHNHRDRLDWLASRSGPVPVAGVASGSATRAHGGEPPARYKLFRFSGFAGGGPSVEMIVRGLADERGPVTELSRTVLTSPA